MQATPASAEAAAALMHAFAGAFNLTATPPCRGNPGDPWNDNDMTLCLFPLYSAPMGPFPVGQWSAFIPPNMYEEVSRWVVQRRGTLDVLFHPNSGCEIHDHTNWTRWSGTPWRLDVSIMSCNSPGCIPKQ